MSAARTCLDCGADISGRGNGAKRCELCATASHHEKTREGAHRRLAEHPELVRAAQRRRYAAHPEHARELGRAAARRRRVEHPELVLAAQRRQFAAHPERAREVARASYRRRRAAHPERIRELAREAARRRRAEHPELVLAAQRRWCAAHPELRRAAHRRRRSRELQLLGTVSPNIERVLLRRHSHTCAACRKEIGPRGTWHLDHILPLALGGLHDDANLQILCVFCNLSKGAKHPEEWEGP